MGRLIGYMANRSDRLAAALHQERAAVMPPHGEGATSWGLGFYQNGEVLHKKLPQFQAKEFDWERVAHDVLSDCVVLHLRQPTVGDFRTHNTHPFRMRRWLFAHAGTIAGFDRLEAGLRGALPEFLARNIRGTTDSEVLFHLILSFLHEERQLDNPNVQAEALVSAVRSAVSLVDSSTAELPEQPDEPATLNLVLTNGRMMIALRRGSPMAWVQQRGIREPRDEPESKTSPSNVLRYVMVVGDTPDPLPAGYTSLSDGEMVVVDRNLTVHSHLL